MVKAFSGYLWGGGAPRFILGAYDELPMASPYDPYLIILQNTPNPVLAFEGPSTAEQNVELQTTYPKTLNPTS